MFDGQPPRKLLKDRSYIVTWEKIDRDLDIAIHEFAPGAVLLKDKLEHLCVGFSGILPDVDYRPGDSPAPLAPLSDPFVERYFDGKLLKDRSYIGATWKKHWKSPMAKAQQILIY